MRVVLCLRRASLRGLYWPARLQFLSNYDVHWSLLILKILKLMFSVFNHALNNLCVDYCPCIHSSVLLFLRWRVLRWRVCHHSLLTSCNTFEFQVLWRTCPYICWTRIIALHHYLTQLECWAVLLSLHRLHLGLLVLYIARLTKAWLDVLSRKPCFGFRHLDEGSLT